MNVFCASLSLSITSVLAGLALVVLIMTARCPQQQSLGNFENEFYYLQKGRKEGK